MVFRILTTTFRSIFYTEYFYIQYDRIKEKRKVFRRIENVSNNSLRKSVMKHFVVHVRLTALRLAEEFSFSLSCNISHLLNLFSA